MPLQDDLIAASAGFAAPFQRQMNGCLTMEALIAERKAFLTKKKLTYKCKLRVDDSSRTVRFWEMLVEKGSGVSAGDDMSPGFGLKKETYGTSGKTRSGSIEEASNLFGKEFTYLWDYAAVRTAVRTATEAAGYTLDVVLNPKSV
jgi:hypothetical protein